MSVAIIADNNKRIAKNTLFLYFRMLLTMLVALYTVRIVLKTLGVVDYGIYNVVGSIVTMFSFLSNTMSSASQRFFAFEIGRNDREQLKKTFSTTMTIYLLIALVILILAETIGLWFLNVKMEIPQERMAAARWVYQFSILGLMLTMFTVPYNAAIIAHENMKVYAYVSVIEVALKLLIVYLLVLFSFDKLILYSVLTLAVTFIVTLIYRTYCQRKFEECHYSFHWDKHLFKKILSYSGWNLLGALSGVGKNHGINILINVFFGPAVNAARGVAYQVQSVVLNFGNNFFTAVRPQIIKSYAANRHEEMMQLVFQSTKFSFYVLFLLSLPILLEASAILGLWLDEVPAYSIMFIKLVIVDTLLELMANPIVTLAQATGKVKWYQIVVGGVRLLSLPIALVFLKTGFGPESVFYTLIANTVLCNALRIVMIKQILVFDASQYLKQVVCSIALVSSFSLLVPRLIQIYWTEPSVAKSLTTVLVAGCCSVTAVWLLGLTKPEREFVSTIVLRKLKLKFGQV
jgi:O-antigen/teichoic acid export membrane protein